MDGYTITNIDATINAVYIHMVYGDAILDDTIFVADLTNTDSVKQDVNHAYQKFCSDIDRATIKADVSPQVTTSLIGFSVDIQLQ